jgi:hypothetical protein
MELSAGLVNEFEKLKQRLELKPTDEELQQQAENEHDLMLMRHYAQADRAVAIANAVGMHRLFTGADDLYRQYYSEWATIEQQDDRLVQARITRLDHVERSIRNIETGIKGSSVHIDLRLADSSGAFATKEDSDVVTFHPANVSSGDWFGVRKKVGEHQHEQVEYGGADWQEIDQILDTLQTSLAK